MNPVRLLLTALIAMAALSATSQAADKKTTLDNGLLQVTLNEHGLERIHDKKIDRTIDLASDRFSLTVDGNVIKSSSITPTVKKENATTVTYAYRSGKYTVSVVYELQPGWRFVSKQLLLTGPKDKELLVDVGRVERLLIGEGSLQELHGPLVLGGPFGRSPQPVVGWIRLEGTVGVEHVD